mmetsp:Transcript_5603/g.21170  ORF Transcript_5603/g.21170 Transcript_5603/m.21170 type:complete len:388 (+) Transcript_5603:1671-2834(+)
MLALLQDAHPREALSKVRDAQVLLVTRGRVHLPQGLPHRGVAQSDEPSAQVLHATHRGRRLDGGVELRDGDDAVLVRVQEVEDARVVVVREAREVFVQKSAEVFSGQLPLHAPRGLPRELREGALHRCKPFEELLPERQQGPLGLVSCTRLDHRAAPGDSSDGACALQHRGLPLPLQGILRARVDLVEDGCSGPLLGKLLHLLQELGARGGDRGGRGVEVVGAEAVEVALHGRQRVQAAVTHGALASEGALAVDLGLLGERGRRQGQLLKAGHLVRAEAAGARPEPAGDRERTGRPSQGHGGLREGGTEPGHACGRLSAGGRDRTVQRRRRVDRHLRPPLLLLQLLLLGLLRLLQSGQRGRHGEMAPPSDRPSRARRPKEGRPLLLL